MASRPPTTIADPLRLRCDFILQPQLGSRRPLVGTEVQLAQTARRLCPRCEALTAQMYRDALNLGISGQVHDFTTVLDNRSEQFYFDVGHVNEAGSAIIANSLAADRDADCAGQLKRSGFSLSGASA